MCETITTRTVYKFQTLTKHTKYIVAKLKCFAPVRRINGKIDGNLSLCDTSTKYVTDIVYALPSRKPFLSTQKMATFFQDSRHKIQILLTKIKNDPLLSYKHQLRH